MNVQNNKSLYLLEFTKNFGKFALLPTLAIAGIGLVCVFAAPVAAPIISIISVTISAYAFIVGTLGAKYKTKEAFGVSKEEIDKYDNIPHDSNHLGFNMQAETFSKPQLESANLENMRSNIDYVYNFQTRQYEELDTKKYQNQIRTERQFESLKTIPR